MEPCKRGHSAPLTLSRTYSLRRTSSASSEESGWRELRSLNLSSSSESGSDDMFSIPKIPKSPSKSRLSMLLPFLVDALSKDALIPIQKLTLFIEGDLKGIYRCLREGDLMSMTRAGQTYISLDVLREILRMVGRTDVLDSVDFIARHFDMYSKGNMDGFYLNTALQGGVDKRYRQVVNSLSKRVNGATNVPCKGGIADIITETDII